MPSHGADRIRNVVFLGHSHDGKTTLAEAMLFATGTVPRMGATDTGTSVMDFEAEEQRRKISIGLGVASVEHGAAKVNLLDAPGFPDFVGQVASGLSVAEAALVVVSAGTGLAVGTELAWQQCNRHSKPRLVVVNKMDKENADYFGALEAMRSQLSPRPVPLQIPIGAEAGFKGVVDLLRGRAYLGAGDGKYVEGEVPAELAGRVEELRAQLAEAAAEVDDGLLEKYLDQGALTDDEVERGLCEGIAAGTVAPVVCCSALRLTGILNVLDAVVHLVPPPPVKAEGPTRAFVFNTTADPFVGRVSYLKVISGCLKSDQHLAHAARGADERIGQLFFPRGKEHVNSTEICAGDIGAVAKLQSTATGDAPGDGDGDLPRLEMPAAIYSLAINPKTRGDEEKISTGLARLTEEDPTLRVERSEVTHQHLIRGMGDVHLEVTLEKLRRKYGVEASTETPRIAYRESIAGTARAEGRHVKQSGGHGQYGVCTIEVAPSGHGEGFTWEDKIFGGSIPHNFRPSVEKGIRDAMERGLVAGYPMVDVKVTLVDGKAHPVDSSDMAFQLAGALAMRKATSEANPVILEPILDVEVRVPERYLGDVMSDLNGKRGKISGTEPDASWQVVGAQVPEAEMQRFALDLRSITQGRGTFTVAFSHYEELPQHLAKALIERFQKDRAEP